MTKVDPYNHKERWENWKNRSTDAIEEISDFNSELLLRYLNDMEKGINVASSTKKGARSPTRLNTLRTKLVFMPKHQEKKSL